MAKNSSSSDTQNNSLRNPVVEKESAAKALGILLGHYRRIRGKKQRELADSLKVPPSLIAMFESGERLPSAEQLRSIGNTLQLDRWQLCQLRNIAMYPDPMNGPGDDWLIPDDILTGTPLFLRTLMKEAKFQASADIDEIWIVTNRPLACEGEMFNMLKQRLRTSRTNFVYFVHSRDQGETLRALQAQLYSDKSSSRGAIADRLEFVLTPASFCLFHYGICNPRSNEKRFGRFVVYQKSEPIGFVSMDPSQVRGAFELLDPIYTLCKNKRGEMIDTQFGKFFLMPEFQESQVVAPPRRKRA